MRGLRNTLRQSTVYNYAYGHSVFMQGSRETLIDRVYVQGVMRSTNDMLAANNPNYAAADARASAIGFQTIWGYRLPRGFWMSLQEEGIRAYNGGRTLIDGVEWLGAAENVTVLNSVVRNNRGGVTLVHAKGTKYVENTTVMGNEQGFSIGSGHIVNSYADANAGPIIGFAYSSDTGVIADITVLDTSGARNGTGAIAYIGGRNHNITLRSSQQSVNQNLVVRLSGNKNYVRHQSDALANQNQLTLTGSTINNYTNFPMEINSGATGNSVNSNGSVCGAGKGDNSIN